MYEINDIDLLCSIIQNSNSNKKNKLSQNIKSKRKNNKSGSPQQEKTCKLHRNDMQKLGKENKSSNNSNQESVSSNNIKTKLTSKQNCKEHPSESELVAEECKEIDDLKTFLKNCCKSKRKVLIKPNIPAKWITGLRAKLAKIQSM